MAARTSQGASAVAGTGTPLLRHVARRVRRLVGAGLVITGVLLLPLRGHAHPLGNFSINHYSGIVVRRDLIEVRYFIDMAEIPTFQEIQETGIVPVVGHAGLGPYLVRRAHTLREGLRLAVNEHRLELSSHSEDVVFPPGAGGLPTMRVGVLYQAAVADLVPGRLNRLHYQDENFPGRAGWKEIVATGSRGVEVAASTVPDQDRSRELTDYPTDLLNSPPQSLEARLDFRIDGPSPVLARADTPVAPQSPTRLTRLPREGLPARLAAAPANVIEPVRLRPGRPATPRSAFTELLATRELGLWVVLSAIVVAAGLGALHALEPGHGKTVVAAYLVGSRGTAWHATVLGLTVTASHTAGVYLLGAVTLYASRYVLPERLYPWLGAISGLTIAGLGVFLLLRRCGGNAHTHEHPHSYHHHDHGHVGDHDHAHGGRSHHHHAPTVSLRELTALGVTGGIVPCPAALVVLLSALSLNRVGFGLILIVAFSVGLAAALITIGLLMVSARRLVSRFHGEGSLVTRWLPLSSAAAIAVVGVAIAVQSLVAAGVLRL